MTTLEHTPNAGAPGSDDWVLAGDDNNPAAPADAGADPNAPQDGEPAPADPVEALAREMGWTPQTEWRGDPTKFVNAAEYIRGTQRIANDARTRERQSRSAFDELRSEFDTRLQAAVDQIRQEVGGVGEQQQRIVKAQYDAARSDLDRARLEAYKAGNDAQFKEIEKTIADLDKEYTDWVEASRPKAPKAQPQVDYNAQAASIMSHPIHGPYFQDEGAWMLQDGGERAFDAFFAELSAALQRGATDGQALDVASRVADRFRPREQRQQQQQRDPATGQFSPRNPPALAPGQRVAGRAQVDPAIASLPAHAKAELDRLVKAGEVKDPVRWAKVFSGERTHVLD